MRPEEIELFIKQLLENEIIVFLVCFFKAQTHLRLFFRSGVKSVIILLPLLGVTWVFGVLTLSQDTLVFQYLFAICNSLQVNVKCWLLPNSPVEPLQKQKKYIRCAFQCALISFMLIVVFVQKCRVDQLSKN